MAPRARRERREISAARHASGASTSNTGRSEHIQHRERLIALVSRIKQSPPDAELDRLLAELSAAVPDPNVSDLIFWNDLTAEEVVDRALAYEVIAFGPGEASP